MWKIKRACKGQNVQDYLRTEHLESFFLLGLFAIAYDRPIHSMLMLMPNAMHNAHWMYQFINSIYGHRIIYRNSPMYIYIKLHFQLVVESWVRNNFVMYIHKYTIYACLQNGAGSCVLNESIHHIRIKMLRASVCSCQTFYLAFNYNGINFRFSCKCVRI